MRNFVKFGLVGFAGYLVGFYECKYKTLKVVLEGKLKEETKEKEEAQ